MNIIKFKTNNTYLILFIFFIALTKNNLNSKSFLEIKNDYYSDTLVNTKEKMNIDYYNQQTNYYFEKGYDNFYKNPVIANKDFISSYKFALKSKNDTSMIISSKHVGITFGFINKTDSSILYLQKSLIHARKVKFYDQIIGLNNLLVKGYIKKNKINEIYYLFSENDSLLKYKSKDINPVEFIAYKVIQSNFFLRNKNFKLALESIDNAREFSKKNKIENKFLSLIDKSEIDIYIKMKNFNKAINICKKLVKNYKNNHSYQTNFFATIGSCYEMQNNSDSAILYYIKSLNYANKYNNTINTPFIKLQLAYLYSNTDISKTKQFLSEINEIQLEDNQRKFFEILNLNLSQTEKLETNETEKIIKDIDNTSTKVKSYNFLYNINTAKKDHKRALFYLKKIKHIEDSIKQDETNFDIQSAIIENIFKKKDSELIIIKNKSQKKISSKNKVIALYVLLLLLSVFCLLLIYKKYIAKSKAYTLSNKKIIELKRKNEEIKNELLELSFISIKDKMFIKKTKEELKRIKTFESNKNINSLYIETNKFIAKEKEEKILKDKIQNVEHSFFKQLDDLANLSKKEKKMAALLKVDLSTKEIAPLLNVSDKTIEKYRYMLRKKLQVPKTTKLHDFLKSI